MIRPLLGAFQFLTIFPIRASTAPPGHCAGWFPLVGAVLGYLGASVYIVTTRVLPVPVAALTVLAFWIVASGGLHEDGLADCADAFRAGRSPQRILAIMKDSRVGTYGALAVVLSVLFRWQSVAGLQTPAIPFLVCAQSTPRLAMVWFAYVSRPFGTGMGQQFSHDLSPARVLLAIITGLGLLFLLPPASAVCVLLVNLLLIYGAREYFYARLGGVTGDCFGAVEQLSEIGTLLIFLCPVSTWSGMPSPL